MSRLLGLTSWLEGGVRPSVGAFTVLPFRDTSGLGSDRVLECRVELDWPPSAQNHHHLVIIDYFHGMLMESKLTS